MLKECNIPITPSSPYNAESNGLTERHMGLAKMLLKKCLAAKEDYMVTISAMNTTTRASGFSPAEMSLRRKIPRPPQSNQSRLSNRPAVRYGTG